MIRLAVRQDERFQFLEIGTLVLLRLGDRVGKGLLCMRSCHVMLCHDADE